MFGGNYSGDRTDRVAWADVFLRGTVFVTALAVAVVGIEICLPVTAFSGAPPPDRVNAPAPNGVGARRDR